MPEKFQTILFLVRHGETDRPYNIDPKTDNLRQLTDQGRKQAVACGRFLDQFGPTAIYSSPLARCKQTTEIILNQLQDQPKVIFSDKLMESYLPTEQSREEMGNRKDWLIDEVVSNNSGNQIVLSTHQVFINSIVADFRGVKYHEVPCGFADVYRLVFADSILVEATLLQPAHGV